VDTIDDYIAQADVKVRPILKKIRALVRKAAPGAVEKISYRMPAFALQGELIYFAAFKKHIGMYPPVRDPGVRSLIAPYAGPKGNLQFQLDEPMPYPLIVKIVRARMKENAARALARAASKKKSPRSAK